MANMKEASDAQINFDDDELSDSEKDFIKK